MIDAENSKKTAPGVPFKKGQSGNPGGRPKTIAAVRDLARKHSFEAIETLVTIMRNKNEPASARRAAASDILDRGYGKPTQLIGEDEDNRFKHITEIMLVGPKVP